MNAVWRNAFLASIMSPWLFLESYDVLYSYYRLSAECTHMVSRLNGEVQRAEGEERGVQGGKDHCGPFLQEAPWADGAVWCSSSSSCEAPPLIWSGSGASKRQIEGVVCFLVMNWLQKGKGHSLKSGEINAYVHVDSLHDPVSKPQYVSIAAIVTRYINRESTFSLKLEKMGSSILLIKCDTIVGEGRNVCGEMNV